MRGSWLFGWYAPHRPGHTPLCCRSSGLRSLAPLSLCERGVGGVCSAGRRGMGVWVGLVGRGPPLSPVPPHPRIKSGAGFSPLPRSRPFALRTFPPLTRGKRWGFAMVSPSGTFAQPHRRWIRDQITVVPRVAPPLWMDVPSAEAPAYAGMTDVVQTFLRGEG